MIFLRISIFFLFTLTLTKTYSKPTSRPTSKNSSSILLKESLDLEISKLYFYYKKYNNRISPEDLNNRIFLDFKEYKSTLHNKNLFSIRRIIPKKFLPKYIRDTSEHFPIIQREFSVAKYNTKNPIQYLKTFGIASCVGLSLYDHTNKVGLVAHFDSTNNIILNRTTMYYYFTEHGGKNLTYFEKNKPLNKDITATIIISEQSDKGIIKQIKNMLSQWNIKEIKINEHPSWSMSFSLSLKDGTIYKLFKLDQTYKKEIDRRINEFLPRIESDFRLKFIPQKTNQK